MTKIYTYYENLNDTDPEMHESLLGVWEESWKKQGFDPIILSIDDAKKSSLFNQYMDLVQEVHIEVRGGAGLKQKNPVHKYWLAAQREIAAFHTIQEPSFISDYDVINKSFRFDHKIDSKCRTSISYPHTYTIQRKTYPPRRRIIRLSRVHIIEKKRK